MSIALSNMPAHTFRDLAVWQKCHGLLRLILAPGSYPLLLRRELEQPLGVPQRFGRDALARKHAADLAGASAAESAPRSTRWCGRFRRAFRHNSDARRSRRSAADASRTEPGPSRRASSAAAPRLRRRCRPRPHPLRRRPACAGCAFDGAGRRDAGLERQRDARQLAARGDLVERLQFLADVGRDQDLRPRLRRARTIAPARRESRRAFFPWRAKPVRFRRASASWRAAFCRASVSLRRGGFDTRRTSSATSLRKASRRSLECSTAASWRWTSSRNASTSSSVAPYLRLSFSSAARRASTSSSRAGSASSFAR